MSLKCIDHYALENHPTVYDEESLTALELAGRTAHKVNECVMEINRHEEKCDKEHKEQNDRIEELFTVGIKEHVHSWLDAHPEATTTVQDGALTMEKFHKDTRMQIENGYITPQMFGAVGDGETDDTKAFADMLAQGNRVFIPSGNYKITEPLTTVNSVYGETGSVIHYYPPDGNSRVGCINVKGSRTLIGESLTCAIAGKVMTLNIPVDIKPSDIIYIVSQEKGSAYGRDYETKQDIVEVESVSGSTITFTTVPEWQEITVATIHKLNMVKDVEVANLNIQCERYTAGSCGVVMNHVHNGTVHNCHVSNFDYAQVLLYCCVNMHVHSCYCSVNYTDNLQYGIISEYVYHGTISGNTVNSERTAIDMSYGSQYLTISGNSVRGNINSHWAIKCMIIGNTINDGFVLIRGKNMTVSNNVINLFDGDNSCIDIMEGGMEGGHVIEGNVCHGVICLKAVTSGCRIINNTFKATRCPLYFDTEASMIRVSAAPNSMTYDAGCEISGNHLEYLGDVSIKYGIDMYYNTTVKVFNIRIANNVIRNVGLGINAILRNTTDTGKNLTIIGNDIQNVVEGISFNRMDNTVISNNNIRGSEVHSTNYGIRRGSATQNVNGLIISGNLITGFPEGLNITAGGGVIYKTVIEGNCYVDCEVRRNIHMSKVRVQPIEYPVIPDASGNRYILSVSDGVVTATAQDEL